MSNAALVVKQITNVVERDYNGMMFKFREDGYFNMTHAAKQFGKHIDDFFRLDGSKTYMIELAKILAPADVRELGWEGMVKDSRCVITDIVPGNRYVENRGTWAHPKLAVFFARWLDVKFAVFCDMVIDDLMHGHSVITVVDAEKAVAPKLPGSYIESLEQLIEALKEQDRLKEVVEEKVAIIEHQAPKVNFYDEFVEADGALGIQAASKLLKMNMRELGHWLVDKKLCFRKMPMNTLSPYATAVDRGLFSVKVGVRKDFFQADKMYEQMRITSKGLCYIAKEAPAYVRKGV